MNRLLLRFDACLDRHGIAHRWVRAAAVAAGGAAVLVAFAIAGPDRETDPAAAARPAGRPVTIAWGGDTTLGSSHGLPPRHGFAALAPVARLLRAADLSAVNSEGTFATGGSSKCGGPDTATCFAFRAPPRNAAALRRAGVDIVNLANNHAFDFGAIGMGETVRALRRVGVAVTGRPAEVRVLSIAGARIAFVGFSAYPWSSPIGDPVAIRAIVRDAARRANVVVAFVHAGAEGADKGHTPPGPEDAFGEARGDVRAFAHTAVDAGADLVVGSGPHVLRGMELYRHRLIAYSLGNLAGYRNFGTSGALAVSGILRATVGGDGSFLVGRLESLRLDGRDPHVDPAHAAARAVSELSAADFGAAAVTVGPSGDLVAPG